MIGRFISSTSGTSAIDYSLVAALMSVTILTAMTLTGNHLNSGLGSLFKGFDLVTSAWP